MTHTSSLPPPLTLGDQIAEALTLDILLQRAPPGSLLRESQLTERFGVSRSSVREALDLLEDQGLVDTSARKGFAVIDYRPEELEVLIRYHSAVFGLTCRIAAEVGNVAAIADVERATMLLRQLAQNSDSAEEYELARMLCYDAVQRATGIADALNRRRKFVGRMRHPYSIAAVATKEMRTASAARWTHLADLLALGDGPVAEQHFHSMVAATMPTILAACSQSAISRAAACHG